MKSISNLTSLFIIIILISLSVGVTHESFDYSNNNLLDSLQKAALDVIAQHDQLTEQELNLNNLINQPINLDFKRSKRNLPLNNVPIISGITSIHDFVADQYSDRQRIADIINKLKQRFTLQQSYIESISRLIKYAVRPKHVKVFNSHQVIENIIALNGVFVSKSSELVNVFWKNSPITIQDLKYKLNDLERAFGHLKTNLGRFNGLLNDVVFKNTQSIINGTKVFKGNNQLILLNTKFLTNYKIDNVLKNLFKRDYSGVKLRGTKTLIKPILAKGSINSKLINGKNLISEAILTNQPQTIHSEVKFNQVLEIFQNLEINGRINNIIIPNNIIHVNHPKVIVAPKSFMSIGVTNGLFAKTIDGINLQEFVGNSLLSTYNQTVMSSLTFKNQVKTEIIINRRTLNNYDIVNLANSFVYRTKPGQRIQGVKVFVSHDLFIKGYLNVFGAINRRSIPGELLLTNQRQIISGPKHFSGVVRFEHEVRVNGFVNGLRFPHDIVTLTNQELIVGPISFNEGILVDKNIDAKGLVDGIDISRLNKISIKINDNKIIGNVQFHNLVKIKNLFINHTINDQNIPFYHDIIFKNNLTTPLVIENKIFTAPVQIENLLVQQINRHAIDDFVSTKVDDTVFGRKIFIGLIAFNNIEIFGLIDNVNLTNLYLNTVKTRIDHQEMIGNIRFLDHFRVNSLAINGTINGIRVNDLVVKTRFQNITAKKIFNKNFIVNNLTVKGPTISKGTIDNLIIDDILKRRIQLNRNYTIPNQVIFINCNASNINIQHDINYIDINKFVNNIMLRSKEQIVFAPKKFLGIQFNVDINAEKGINGIPLEIINSNAIHLHGNNIIKKNIKFVHNIHIEKPIFVRTINNINLTKLSSESVKKSGVNIIRSFNTFIFGFNVVGNVHCQRINNIHFGKEVLTKTRNHTFARNIIFTNDFQIINNVIVHGLINQIRLEQFEKSVMKTGRFNLLFGDLEFRQPINISSNLMISGLINQLNFSEIIHKAIYKVGDQTIHSRTTIDAPINISLNLKANYINDLNISQMLNEIILIDSPIEQHVFTKTIFKQNLNLTRGINIIKGTTNFNQINNVNLSSLVINSVKVNEPVLFNDLQVFKNITIITSNTTEIIGRINNIDLNREVILVNHNPPNGQHQVITGRKAFNYLHIDDKLVVNGLINDFNLGSIYDDTLYLTGSHSIIKHKRFLGTINFINGNNHIQFINQLKFPQDFVTLHKDNLITGQLIFNNTLNLRNHFVVSGLINGLNLTNLFEHSMYKDVPHLISKPIIISTAIFKSNVRVDGNVDNVDLSKLSNNINQFTRTVNISKELMDATISRHKTVMNYLRTILEKSIYEVDKFVLHKILGNIYGDRVEVSGIDTFDIIEDHQNGKFVHTMKFDSRGNVYENSTNNYQVPFIKRRYFYLSNEKYEIHLGEKQNISSRVFKDGKVIGDLGIFIKDIEIQIIQHQNFAFLLSLTIDGQLKVHTIVHNKDKIVFKFLGTLIVGDGKFNQLFY